MHLYVVARANKPMMDAWVNDLNAIYLPYKGKGGKNYELQLSVRPIQLFEIAYPEEHHEQILRAISPNDNRAKALAGVLRRVLRLERIKPARIKGKGVIARRHPHVSVMGVGTKKDARDDNLVELI